MNKKYNELLDKHYGKVLLGVVLLYGLSMYGLLYNLFESPSKQARSPQFKVGDCVVLTTKRESWERPNNSAFRIDQVGEKSYKVSVWIGGNYGWIGDEPTDTLSIPFTLNDSLSKTECPSEAK